MTTHLAEYLTLMAVFVAAGGGYAILRSDVR